MFPIPINAINSRFEQMQQDLDNTVRTLVLLAEQLRPVLELQGPNPTLRRLLEVESPTRHAEWIARVEQAIVSGKTLGELRELTGLIWDEVHGFPNRWKMMSPTEKQRMARRVLMRQALTTL